jgi:hypothetical protein
MTGALSAAPDGNAIVDVVIRRGGPSDGPDSGAGGTAD